MANENAREFGWEDTIEHDSTGFVLLEPGEYEFWVDSFERARYSGSSKLPPCNQAVVMIKIMSEDGQECTIKHNLFFCFLFFVIKPTWHIVRVKFVVSIKHVCRFLVQSC